MLYLTDLSSDHHFVISPSSGKWLNQNLNIVFLHDFEDSIVYIEFNSQVTGNTPTVSVSVSHCWSNMHDIYIYRLLL
jgi:hypothetical protein